MIFPTPERERTKITIETAGDNFTENMIKIDTPSARSKM